MAAQPQPLLDADGGPAIYSAQDGSPEAAAFTATYENGLIVCDSPNGYVITRQTSDDPKQPPGMVIFDETNPTNGTPWTPPWGVAFFRLWKHP